MLVLTLGVKGVGKSFILERMEKIANMDGKIISFGDVMLEIAGKELGDREKLSSLPLNAQKEIQEKAAKKIKKISENKLILLDTHGFIVTQPSDTLLPGSPFDIVKILDPHFILLIDAKPEIIYERYRKDKELGKRERVDLSLKQIEEALIAEKSVALCLSATLGVPLRIFENNENIDKLEEKIRTTTKVIKEIK